MRKPLYGQRCFDQLPDLIRHALTGAPDAAAAARALGNPIAAARYDTVVLVLLDGFGWRTFARHEAELPFLRQARQRGDALTLTSQFPSTTAAHVTTLNTGLPSARSGVAEWWYYEPTLGRAFAPLRHIAFDASGDSDPIDASRTHTLLPDPTLYRTLAASGVASHTLLHARYADSAFSRHVSRGARVWPFTSAREAFAQAVACATQPKPNAQRRYVCVYIDTLDALAHRHGPAADVVIDALADLTWELEHTLMRGLASAPNALVMVTADHGLTEVDGRDAVLIDRALPELWSWVKHTPDGAPIPPVGGKRDMFLHLKDDRRDEAHDALSRALAGRARVIWTDTLLNEGYFGPDPSPLLRARLGDVVVLPEDGELVWWSGGGRFDVSGRRGEHGGLSDDELEIPLLLVPT